MGGGSTTKTTQTQAEPARTELLSSRQIKAGWQFCAPLFPLGPRFSQIPLLPAQANHNGRVLGAGYSKEQALMSFAASACFCIPASPTKLILVSELTGPASVAGQLHKAAESGEILRFVCLQEETRPYCYALKLACTHFDGQVLALTLVDQHNEHTRATCIWHNSIAWRLLEDKQTSKSHEI